MKYCFRIVLGKSRWISEPFTSSDYKNRITVDCFSMVITGSEAEMFMIFHMVSNWRDLDKTMHTRSHSAKSTHVCADATQISFQACHGENVDTFPLTLVQFKRVTSFLKNVYRIEMIQLENVF